MVYNTITGFSDFVHCPVFYLSIYLSISGSTVLLLDLDRFFIQFLNPIHNR
jgi:hypothetical protein